MDDSLFKLNIYCLKYVWGLNICKYRKLILCTFDDTYDTNKLRVNPEKIYWKNK